MFISSIDNMLKHPVDSSFLVRSLVLMAMKYPEAIQDNCPIIYVWLRDNSVSFISAVFDELEVKSIYQDSLHSALSNISFHCIIVFSKQIYVALQHRPCYGTGALNLVKM